MTKSKKLISMLLAVVMLITSCSLSLFAFAAEDDVTEANSLAETALAGMSPNAVSDADKAFINKINSKNGDEEYVLSDDELLQINPLYYAYAIHVATTQVIKDGGKNPSAALRAEKLKALADPEDANHDEVAAAYAAFVRIPEDYITVIKDFNDVNQALKISETDSVLTNTNGNINMISAVLTNLNFGTNETAKALYESFWASFSNYSAAQITFAEFLPCTNSNGVTDAFTTATAGNVTKPSTYNENLNYYFGSRTGDKFAKLYFLYEVAPLNANVVKAKYLDASNNWIDEENGPTEYYNELKDFYTNANQRVRDFYVNYLGAISKTSDIYEGLDEIGKVIDVAFKVQEYNSKVDKIRGDETIEDKDAAIAALPTVPFKDVKEAHLVYMSMTEEGRTLIDIISEKSEDILFNPAMVETSFAESIKFTDEAEASSIEYIKNNPNTVSASNFAGKYKGDKIKVLFDALEEEYAKYKDLDEYEALVKSVAAQSEISPEDVETVWTKFNELNAEFRKIIYDEAGDTWKNTIRVMTSQFVDYVNGVDLKTVTPEIQEEATKRYNDTISETIDEINYDFRGYLTTKSDFRNTYKKYLQIQISEFRKYVEGVDLDNVTEENRTTAKQMFEDLAATNEEYVDTIKGDSELYNRYLTILASDFKEYVKSVDLDKVDDETKKEAKSRYQALSDDAKATAYNDEETWTKYAAIVAPEVDPEDYKEEAAKKAENVEIPSADSEAIKALGYEKSIDNVEDFVIDDLLPNFTDQIKIDDKNDVVNSALKQHLTNANIGKIYSLYATISHNKTAVDPVNMPGVVVSDIVPLLIPTYNMADKLYEDEFAGAKAKIAKAVASGEIPTDEEGNPVQVPCGTNEDGTTAYEDANLYDAIAAISFENGDFGFEDGDRDGFEKALLAALRPITSLCSPYNGINATILGVDFFNHVDKATGEYTFGVYESVVKLLEPLGVKDLPTDKAYRANYDKVYKSVAEGGDTTKAEAIAGDELLKPVIDGVFSLVDDEIHSLTDIFILIPRLGDIINSDIPETAYKNIVRDLGMLSGFVTDIKIQEQPLDVIVKKGVLAPALLSLINSKLEGVGIKLNMPDWEKLNSYTTVKVNKSAQFDKEYVPVRYIKGDDMFTLTFYYLYDSAIADSENAAALKEKIGGFPLVGSNIKTLIEKAEKAGKMKTYAAVLDFFYDNGENKDATADAGKSIGDAIKSLNNTLNLSQIDASAAKVKLSRKRFTYNKKIRKPSVKVTLNGEVLKKGVAYKVVYSKKKPKKIGEYKVTVKFIGAYKGADKTLTYTIGPKNARRVKVKSIDGGFRIKYKKSRSKSCKGYIVEYSTNKKFNNSVKVKVAGRKKTSKKVTGLKKGTKYYVRIKAYTVKNGKTIYSPNGKRRAVKAK